MRSILNLVCILIPLISFSQNYKNNLTIELGYGLITYKMGAINEYFIDSVNPVLENINSGQSFNVDIGYKPIELLSFSFYGNYQYKSLSSQHIIMESDEYGFPIKEHQGNFDFKIEAMIVGLSTTFYFNHLLRFQEKNILNKLHLGVELKGGIGFSKVSSDIRYCSLPLPSNYFFWKSQDFQGQISVKIEYDFTQSPIFTTLGLRLGYQYFKTKTVKDRFGEDWIVQNGHPINLDFSGFYGGVYLKIGK